MYEDRIIFFADILGFRELVESSVDANGFPVQETIDKLESILYNIRLVWDIGEDMDRPIRNESERISHFSDTIVVSFKIDDESAVFRTLDSFHNLVCYLAAEGFFVRGGIARGFLHHEPNVIYGPALVAAYDLERLHAKFPRIILDKRIIDVGVEYGSWGEKEREWVEKTISEDTDGYYFVDYFRKADWTYPDPWRFEYYNGLRDHIVVGLTHPKDRVREKYEWMMVKFNELVDHCHTSITFTADSEEEARDIAAAYASIEYINLSGPAHRDA